MDLVTTLHRLVSPVVEVHCVLGCSHLAMRPSRLRDCTDVCQASESCPPCVVHERNETGNWETGLPNNNFLLQQELGNLLDVIFVLCEKVLCPLMRSPTKLLSAYNQMYEIKEPTRSFSSLLHLAFVRSSR